MNPVLLSSLTRELRRTRKARRGMNLLEIMIVVAIVVILIGVLGVGAFQAFQNFKVGQTKLKIQQIAQVVNSEIFMVGGDLPNSLSDIDGIKEGMRKDGWGREFEFVVPGPGDYAFDIISYGEDGTEGGTGRSKDIRYSELSE